MRITLVIPPAAFLLDDRCFPFLGPLQIAAVARERGHDVRVSDLTGYKRRHPDVKHAKAEDVLGEARAQLLTDIEWAPDLVGFYSLAPQHPHVVELHKTLRESLPEAATVIGGPHANTAPARCIEDGFDYVVVADQGGGGGEPGFLNVLEDEEAARFRKKSHDWFTRKRDSKIVQVPSRTGEEWENDKWPLPARDLIDLESYHYTFCGERGTSIISTTGCPFACSFCSHWGGSKGYRTLEGRSAKRVSEEIQSIKDRYGWRAIMDYSDEANLRPDFESEYMPALRKLDIVWRAFFKNGRHMTREEVFEQMAASGCVELCTGGESANAKILKDIKKGATKEDNRNFVRYCVKYGIRPKVFFQVGLPGETPETIEELRQEVIYLASLGLKDFDCSITTPYEGTPMYEHPEQHNIKFDKKELDFSKRVVLYKGVPGEYQAYVSHDRLSREDLVAARQMVEDEGRKAMGLQPLVAKDDG